MLKFACFGRERQPDRLNLDGAYAVGNDGVPVRAEIGASSGLIACAPRTADPIGLALMWPVDGFGTVLLETTRLPLRDKPYNLHVELARHRLMRISLKREEWGLFDYPGLEEISKEIDQARGLFVSALQHQSEPLTSAKLADQSLSHAMRASERLCRFHASVFLSRRQKTGGFGRRYLGAAAPTPPPSPSLASRMREALDFIRIPTPWRDLQPKEQGVNYAHPDAWAKQAAALKLSITGGPLLNFGVRFVPDWMYIWQNDYESLMEYAAEHIRRTVRRYAGAVTSWIAASGIHAESVFDLSVEQIIELTRMATTIVKQTAARSQVIIELTQPWGEYYARNQRSIPPQLYADMVVQSGVQFDAFGLQFLVGGPGFHVRDLFQISGLIDRLANVGKPLHVTATACPSGTVDSRGNDAGRWHDDWSDSVQSEWIEAMLEICLSKPYVDTVCLQELADVGDQVIPLGGLLRGDLSPKPAFERVLQIRKRLVP